jgi:hypothetical protein
MKMTLLETLKTKTTTILTAIENGATVAEATELTRETFWEYRWSEFYIGATHVSYFLRETIDAIVLRDKTTKTMAKHLNRFNAVLDHCAARA